MQTLADIRAAAKAGKLKPHVVTSTATPTSSTKPASSTSKTDPLAALRAKLNSGKSGTSTSVSSSLSAPAGLLGPTRGNSDARLARLDLVVNALAASLPAAQLTSLKAQLAKIG